MIKQALSHPAAVPAAPSRFDLRLTGLSEAQLKAIAGARMAEKTSQVTTEKITKCCWGV
jgi:hypothetical protein